MNVPSEETRHGQPLHVRIAHSIRSNGLSLTHSQLEQQIRPICEFNTFIRHFPVL